jgi:hypothetical protein
MDNHPPPQQQRPRKLGAVERLGRTSAPAPEAELKARNLNRARARARRGQFYEKAASRRSREKLALEINGEVSRDGAVALGGNRPNKKRQRSVLMESSMETIFEEKGRQRARKIAMANIQQQQEMFRAANHKKAPRSGPFKENHAAAPKRPPPSSMARKASSTFKVSLPKPLTSFVQSNNQPQSTGSRATSNRRSTTAPSNLYAVRERRPARRARQEEEEEVIDLTDD